MKEIEQDSSLDDLARQALVDPYQEAIKLIGEAGTFRALEQKFAASLQGGAAKVEQLRSDLATLGNAGTERVLPEGIGPQSSTRDVEAALTREKAALATIQNELKAYEGELAAIVTRAPVVGERRIAARKELGEVKSRLATAEGQAGDRAATARKVRLQALEAKLEQEIAMLEREAASAEIRGAIAEAARDLTAKKADAVQKRILALQDLATSLMADTLRRAEKAVERIRSSLPNPPAKLADLLGEFTSLIEETGKITGEIISAESELRRRENELRKIELAFEDVKRLSDLSGQEGVLGMELMEQLRALPAPRDTERWMSRTGTELAEARGRKFALQRAWRDEVTDVRIDPSIAESVPKDLSAEIAALLKADVNLREELRAGNKRLVGTLGDRLQIERQIEETSREFRSFAREKMIMIRTSPTFGRDTLRSLPGSLGELFGVERLQELGRRLVSVPVVIWVVPALLLVLLVGMRPFLGRALQRAGQRTRRISTDSYRQTLVAFGTTVLLAAPAPLVTTTLGLVLLVQPDASYWSFALGKSLVSQWFFLFTMFFLIGACRRFGLGEMHFRWSVPLLGRLRHLFWWWIAVYVPCELTKSLVFGEPEFSHVKDVGRISGMVMAIGLGVVVALIMEPKKGVAGALRQRVPGSWFGRLQMFWFLLVIVIFTAITALLFAGYLFAGLILLEQIVKTIMVVVVTFVIYCMALRWFAMRERRISVEERLAEQIARVEARRDRELSGAGPEVEVEVEGVEEGPLAEALDDQPMDIVQVGEQTRNLLGFLAWVLMLWGLILVWSEFSPVVNLLDRFSILWGFSLADLGISVLVIAAVVAVTRNLPGLLEIVVLRRLGLDAGTRTAITTLGKYGVIASGVAFLFHTIGMDWSRFSWIAAALSVGLGFGLQEVVANFVCGIILLFERPVRVGDVVTVDGIDGTVSRIQIRATTITNWDRKDFIVPNKQFVTGTLMNWTLSSGLNRILINVGVAYGSDTERVREVLTEVAHAHPDVLKDPPPMVTFENFGDSSLDFVIRSYLPNLDRRIAVIDELHTAINRRFREEGIEIPFPQRDLHIRTGEAGR